MKPYAHRKTYAYRAVDAFGEVQTGWLDAVNPTDLEARLRYFRLDLISAKVSLRHHNRLFFLYRGFRHLSWFCQNLYRLVSRGVPLTRALADLKDLTSSPTIREASIGLLEGIFAGQPLSVVFLRSSNIFDAVFVAMAGLGERQGAVAEVFARLGEYSRTLDMIVRLRRYLWFLSISLLGTGLLLVCALFVVTLLEPFSVSTMSIDWTWFTITIFVIAFCLLALYRFGRSAVQQAVDWVEMRWQSQRDTLAFQFLSAFTMLYRAGVEPAEAIEVANKTIRNRYINEIVEAIRKKLLSGEKPDETIQKSGLFPSAIVRIVQVGEAQGAIGDMLAVSCGLLEQGLTEKLSRIKRLLMGLGVLSIICLTIAIAGFTHHGGW